MFDASLESRLSELETYLGPEALGRWREFIVKASDDQLYRINAYEMARLWRRGERDTLSEFIHATRAGLLSLNWDVVCLACGFANKHEHLSSLCSIQACHGCGGNFDVAFDKTVEVTFTVHPAVRPVAPSTTRPTDESAPRVTGLDCATLPAFREFFSAEVLSYNESLEVKDVAIMFTDIKGSTALYNRLGDARAYGAVRKHFDVLFETVARNGGAIVKTIGDSIMASFTRPAEALASAIATQESFNGFRPLLPEATDEIIVRIGIHHGPCIAVTLNDHLDFFGSAINIAARAEQQAGGGETVITQAMREDREVEELLKAAHLSVTRFDAIFKGFSNKFALYKITSRASTDKEAKGRFTFASLKSLLR